MPPPAQDGVPTIVTVKDIEPTLPGINYDPDDPAILMEFLLQLKLTILVE